MQYFGNILSFTRSLGIYPLLVIFVTFVFFYILLMFIILIISQSTKGGDLLKTLQFALQPAGRCETGEGGASSGGPQEVLLPEEGVSGTSSSQLRAAASQHRVTLCSFHCKCSQSSTCQDSSWLTLYTNWAVLRAVIHPALTTLSGPGKGLSLSPLGPSLLRINTHCLFLFTHPPFSF